MFNLNIEKLIDSQNKHSFVAGGSNSLVASYSMRFSFLVPVTKDGCFERPLHLHTPLNRCVVLAHKSQQFRLQGMPSHYFQHKQNKTSIWCWSVMGKERLEGHACVMDASTFGFKCLCWLVQRPLNSTLLQAIWTTIQWKRFFFFLWEIQWKKYVPACNYGNFAMICLRASTGMLCLRAIWWYSLLEFVGSAK